MGRLLFTSIAANLRLGPTASEFGLSWDPAILGRVIEDWAKFGLTRDMSMIDAGVVGEAVIHCMKAPRGAIYASVELQPMGAIKAV